MNTICYVLREFHMYLGSSEMNGGAGACAEQGGGRAAGGRRGLLWEGVSWVGV